ncbi:MAG: hypothetical protein NTV84_09180 [Methanoregula sp.]|nr:hypothetical protein [Methanoregula sp.]
MASDIKGKIVNLIGIIIGAIMFFPSIWGTISFGFNFTYIFMIIVGALFFFGGLWMLITGQSPLDN